MKIQKSSSRETIDNISRLNQCMLFIHCF